MRWVNVRVGWTRRRHGDDGLPTSLATEAVVAAFGNGGEGLWMEGGEIANRPDCLSLVATARSRGFRRIGLTTNGHACSAPNAALRLAKAGATHARVAVHGSTADVHEWIVGQKGAFRHAVNGARAMVRARIHTRIDCVVTRTNMAQLPEIVALAGAIGSSFGMRVAVERARNDPSARSTVPRYSLAQPWVESAFARADELGVDTEITGMPLCFLSGYRARAADRTDTGPAPETVNHGGTRPAPVFGPPCVACALQGACRGASSTYVTRWGWDEFPAAPAVSTDAGRETLTLRIDAIDESSRSLRQRLVRAVTERSTPTSALRLTARASEHPDLRIVIREARRLGLTAIEVEGLGHIEPEGSINHE